MTILSDGKRNDKKFKMAGVCLKRVESQPRTQGTFGDESTLVDRGHVVLLYCPDFGQ